LTCHGRIRQRGESRLAKRVQSGEKRESSFGLSAIIILLLTSSAIAQAEMKAFFAQHKDAPPNSYYRQHCL
jgi:hypothetical protein